MKWDGISVAKNRSCLGLDRKTFFDGSRLGIDLYIKPELNGLGPIQ